MTKMKSCPECGGSGTLLFERVHRQSPSRDVGFIEEYEEPCDNCGGDGKIVDLPDNMVKRLGTRAE